MHEFVITATRSMKDYAALVAKKLAGFPEITPLGDRINGVDILKASCFADGEMEIDVGFSIRGKDVVLFTSCARNDAGIGVTEAKIELYHAVDALKRSQARKIIVFEPFVSCSRSDRTIRRSSVGLWVHFKILASLGTKHILTYQLHSDKSKSMVDPAICLLDDIPALNLLKQHLCDVYIKDLPTLEEVVRPRWAFCSIDAGGEKLARGFANAFGAPLVVAHKQRDYAKVNRVEYINILSAEPIEGKVIWIVDDMVDTAGSAEALIRVLAGFRPAEINLIAVHPVFSPPARRRLAALFDEKILNRVMVTDTVYCPDAEPENTGIEVVSSVDLSAKIINAIITNGPMRKLLRVFDAALYLSPPSRP